MKHWPRINALKTMESEVLFLYLLGLQGPCLGFCDWGDARTCATNGMQAPKDQRAIPANAWASPGRLSWQAILLMKASVYKLTVPAKGPAKGPAFQHTETMAGLKSSWTPQHAGQHHRYPVTRLTRARLQPRGRVSSPRRQCFEACCECVVDPVSDTIGRQRRDATTRLRTPGRWA